MSRRTGGFRYRVAGIFRRTLVLQLEFERQRLVSGTSWPPRTAPERYWRDATLEDLTAVPRHAVQTSPAVPGPTWTETRPTPPPARDC